MQTQSDISQKNRRGRVTKNSIFRSPLLLPASTFLSSHLFIQHPIMAGQPPVNFEKVQSKFLSLSPRLNFYKKFNQNLGEI